MQFGKLSESESNSIGSPIANNTSYLIPKKCTQPKITEDGRLKFNNRLHIPSNLLSSDDNVKIKYDDIKVNNNII